MRKHVKPAHPDATIPDPSRGVDLPPDGLPCEWNVHWARLQMRGDVIVTEIEPETPAPPEGPADASVAALQAADRAGPVLAPPADAPTSPVDEPKPAPGTVASVPFMITAANRKRLRTLGKTDDEIGRMTPEEAQALLQDAPAA